MESIKELLAPYDSYIDSSVGDSQAESLAGEMQSILAVAAVIIVLVLLLTSRSYAEIPVLLLTFLAAALLNLGTNFIFGEISFVSNSVTVVLQLALAIDYAIIMLHRFLEEREHAEDREACIAAVSAAIPSISASSLTTISGLAAMMFMQFRIGFDMGVVLIKAILLSMLSVFTLMPGLLMLFSKAMERTRHRSFIPRIDCWGRLTMKLRYVGLPLFAVALVCGLLLSGRCPYVYGYTQIQTARQNESQVAQHMFILPQILYLGDRIVERTRFNIRMPEVSRSVSGTVYVNGRVRGRISGVVDAHIQGVIHGDVSGLLEMGSYQTGEVHQTDEDETEHP